MFIGNCIVFRNKILYFASLKGTVHPELTYFSYVEHKRRLESLSLFGQQKTQSHFSKYILNTDLSMCFFQVL